MAVTTYHNDSNLTGANVAEKILTTSNVNSANFGKLFSRTIDGQIFAQVLYIPGVIIPGKGVHNVVYACTEHNSVYAFDADIPSLSSPLWQVNLGPSVPSTAVVAWWGVPMQSEIGITSTPVVDLQTNTMYVVAETYENNQTVFRLHALDIATGSEKFNGPVVVQGSVAGTGDGSVGGVLAFNPATHLQRAALALSGGNVYFAFAGWSDTPPYHGWLFGYNAATLQQTAVFCTSPNSGAGGIWHSGAGIAVDPSGSLYIVSGNGTMDANANQGDYGESVVRLSATNNILTVADYYSPSAQSLLTSYDADLGSTGLLLLPGTPLGVLGDKNGMLYVVNRNNLGQYNASADQIVQKWQGTFNYLQTGNGGYFQGLAFYNSTLYAWGIRDTLDAFSFNGSTFNTTPSIGNVTAPEYSNQYGANSPAMSISANGTTTGTGIVWATYSTNGLANAYPQPGILRAFDASNIGIELWNSNQNQARDGSWTWAKWVPPTIANGKVYVPTWDNTLNVFGLLPTGSLNGSVTISTSAVNLTTEGVTDWAHWGEASLTRKFGVPARLSDYTLVGSGAVSSYGTDPRPVSWSDGTPLANGSNNTNGLSIGGTGQGFSISAPADTTTRTLILHAGGSDSGGTLTAHLSDGSAADYTDTSVTTSGRYDRNYTLTYKAGAAGQTLTVTWVMTSGTGSVSLSGAALPGAGVSAMAGNPQSAAINTVFATPLQAIVTDASGNPVNGATVTFTAPSTGASGAFAGSSTATATTNTSGVATAPAFTANSQLGTYNVTSSVAGLTTAASFSLTNTTGAPSSITPTAGTTQSTTIGTAFATPLQVTVVDAGGNPVSGVTVTFMAPSTGASAAFGSSLTATAVTNSSGVAAASALTANTTAGSYVVTASVVGLTSTASFNLTNIDVPASIAPTAGTPQSAPTNTAFTTALQTIVKNASGNPVSGVTVTFTAPSTGASALFGSTATTTAVTNTSGLATASVLTANSTAGSYAVTASVAGLGSTAAFNLTNLGPPAGITPTTGTPQNANVNGVFATALQVTVKDANGNALSGVTVTFTAPSTGASAMFGSTATATALTDASGQATAPALTANGTAGTYTVTASIVGLTSTGTFSLTNIGPPASLTPAAGTPQSTAISTAFTTALQAVVKDAAGNPLSGVTVTFTAPSTGASAMFGSTATATAVTNATGQATAPALTANGTPGTYTVMANVAGLASTGAFSLTNIGPPASITAAAGTPQSAAISTAFTTPLQAVVKDAGGNPLSGVTVTFTVPSTGSSALFGSSMTATALTNASGQATAPALTANSTPGTYVVTASVVGLASTGAFSLTNIGPPASITPSAGTPQSATISSTFVTPLQAMVKDVAGNALSGVTVTFAAPSTGASALFGSSATATAVTNASGQASAPALTASTTTGSYTVTASVTGLPATASFSLTNTAGAPAAIKATAGTLQTAIVGTAFATPLQATVTDVGGNPVSGATVTFTAPSTGSSAIFASGATATAVTNAAGQATAPALTANGMVGAYAVTASVSGLTSTALFSLRNNAVAGSGSLTGAGTSSSAAVNLTTEANTDWQHWGDGSLNRKAGVTPQLSDYTTLGSGTVSTGTNDPRAMSWSDGAPAASGSNNTNAASIGGVGQGFMFTATADTTPRTLMVHVGGSDSGGTFTAHLSDGSAADFTDTTTTTTGAYDRNYTLTYQASTAGQTVSVSWTMASGTGSVSLSAAALSSPNIAASAGTPQSATVNTAFSTGLQVTVTDSAGNPVSGATVTFTAPSTGASATFGSSASATALTNATGQATAPALMANSTAGTYMVTAGVAGWPAPAKFSLTNTAGIASSVTTTAGTPQSAAVNTAFTTGLQATVSDASGNPVSGVTVTFTAPSTGASAAFGSSATATATTNASGQATAPSLTANSNLGSYTVIASIAGSSSTASFNLTNIAGAPSAITATAGTPQSTVVSTAFSTALQATVKDAGGNPVSGMTVTFTAPSTGASAAFGSSATATAVTNANGQATAPALTANSTAGAYTVNASVAGLTTTAAYNLTNTAGAPSSIASTGGTPQSAPVNTAFTTGLQAVVKDAGGNPVSGVTVTFTAPSTGASAAFGSSATATAVTNAGGQATAPALTANSTAGAYTINASVAGLTPTAAYNLTNTAGAPSAIATTAGTPQSAVVNTAFSTGLQATVSDVSGNPVGGITVTFTAPSTGASAAFGSSATATAVTNANGQATAPALTANGTLGSYTVSASVAGLPATATFSLTNTVGPPSSLTTTAGTPQSAVVSTAFSTALQATVKDSGGNPLSGVTVTFTAPSTGPGATFGSSAIATALTNTSGQATAPALTANSAAGSYTVTASVAGLTTTATFNLTNTAGAPSNITATAGTPQSAIVSTAFSTALQATVTDAGGNPVSGITVTFTAPSTGASAAFGSSATATAVTNANGQASAPALTANGTLGSYAVSASVAGLPATATFSLTNTVGAPSSLTTTAGTPQSAVVSTAFSTALQATVKDSGGNPLSGVTVTFTAPSTGPSATFGSSAIATALTNTSGQATAPALTANSAAGNYTVKASVAGLTTTATFNLTNTAGAPSNITATAGTPQSAIVSTAFSTALQATVTDAGGNPVSGITVTFTAPSTGASAAFGSSATATAVTNANGQASAPALTANGTPGAYTVSASVAGLPATATFALTNSPAPVGSLTASATSSSAPVNLTAEGNADWEHWGDLNPNRKSGVSAQLSDYTVVGGGSVATYRNDPRLLSWTDGAPTASSSSNANGVSISGVGQGMSFTAPADTSVRVLAVHVGGTNSAGTFTAHLSDASAADFTETTATATGAYDRNYTLSYQATAPGQTLTVTWVVAAGSGNVTLSAAALQASAIVGTAGTPQSTMIGTGFGTPLQATVTDASANPVIGATVTFTVPSTGASALFGSSTTATVVTNANGQATAPALTANSTSGSYTVIASVNGVAATANFRLTNTGAPASVTATAGTPQSASVNTTFSTAPQATVTDASNNPVSGVTVTFTAPATGASALFGSSTTATAVTNANGQATAPALTANSTSGSYTVIASVNGVAATANFNLTNTGAPASITATAGTPQSASVNTTFPTALQATVTDASNNPVSGITVTFTTPATGAGALFASSTTAAVVTDANGHATAPTLTANSTSGNYTVIASVAGLAPTASFSLTNAAAAPANITATAGTPQSAGVSTNFAAALQATVTDASSNPVAGITVTFTAPATGASATFGSSTTATAVTNASGQATAPALTANSTAGSYAVTATVAGIATTTTFSLTNNPGAPANIAATAGTPQGVNVNTAFATALQATVKDTSNNPVPGVTVTFTAPATGASATFGSSATATAVTNASGQATAPALTANSIAGSYTVAATVGGIATPANFSLTNIARTGIISGTVRSAGGQTVPGAQLLITSVGQSFNAVSDSSGNYKTTALPTGTYSIRASATGFSDAIVNNVVVAPDTTTTVNIQFAGSALSAPTLTSPLNGATGIPVTASLNWNAVAGSSGYSVYLSTTNPPTFVQIASGTSFTPSTAFNPSTTYYWKIASLDPNNGNAESASPVWSFTTASATIISNLALGKPATQSSTMGAYGPMTNASSAVDGNTDGNFNNGSVSHTNFDSNAWWQVDLGSSVPVSSIVIWNRTDCCGDRLSDYWVFVSNTPFNPTDTPATLQGRAGTWSSRQTTFPNPSASIAVNAAGRYVRVQLSGTDYLHLAEVQVFGATSSATTYGISGQVTLSGAGQSGVTVSLSGSQVGSTTTNSSGNYSFTGLPSGGSYTVTPSLSGYTFSPLTQSFNNVSANQTANFIATATPTYGISGQVTLSGAGQSGVTLTLSGSQTGSTTTNSSGNYSFTGLPSGGSYTVIPSLSGYSFSPLSQSFNNLSANQTATFIATATSTSTNSNLALGKPAMQSSTGPYGPTTGASSAVDGNTDGNFNDGSVSHTNADTNAWWQVDLGSSTTVGSIVIWNRTDCCGDRLSDYWVFVSNTPFGPTDTPTTLQGRPGTWSSHQTTFPNPSTNITVNASGRYVRVQLTGTDFLHLAEVQVFGPSSGTTTYGISGQVTLSGAGQNGVTLTLSGSQGGSTTTNSSGNYSFTGLPSGGNYTVTPSLNGYSFSPPSQAFNNLSANQTATFIATATPTYGISGQVIVSGIGQGGVMVTLSGSQGGSTTTNSSGNYSFTGLASGGNYTVTPSLSGYSFNPPSQTFNNLTANQTATFTASPTTTYGISGQVTLSGAGQSGVTVSLNGSQGGSTTTNSSGNYSFTGLPSGGSYTVTPSLSGYTFSPLTQSFNNLSANQTANFIATATPTYGISGQVTLSGAGQSGVTVTLSGSQTGSATTNSSGNYSFTGLSSGGSYTVTPSLSGYSFSPLSQSFNNLSANQTATFTSTATSTSTNSNLALGKPAMQSSNGPYGPTAAASSAVDGNTDGNFNDGSVSHTNADTNAWWQVDLSSSATVSSITIWNRTDCCGDRLSDYWVFVSNTPFGPTDTPATLQGRPGTWSSHQTTFPNPSTNITVNAPGRYVRVQLTGTDFLHLAEVQVFGPGSGTATYGISGQVTLSGVGQNGVKVTLSGSQGGSTTTNSSGNYSFTGLPSGGNYTVTPSLNGYSFSPPSQAFNNLSANQTATFIATATPTYGISGQVTLSGVGQNGVMVTLSGSQGGSTTTNSSGNYTFTGLASGGNYTVTPSLSGYSFNPPNQTFNNLSANQTATFTATATSTTTYGISGQVTLSGAGQNGVTLTLSGSQSGSTTTNSSGNYSFTGLPSGGNYTVTPSLSGYTFNPPNQIFNNLNANQTATFTATATSTTSNLALGKPATQSSTGPYGPTAAASSAVDGNTDGNFNDGSVSHTNADANAWWQVDLSSSATVSSITIWNRTDCCGDRLNDYWVFVSNTPFGPTDTPATLQGRPGTWSSHQATFPNPSSTIPVNAPGRYVRVQISGTNYLHLAEVQVFGQ